uniref:Major facilitator superfamily (MFS) profile domain-containing protein n=1 Tax=Globisporangium ultimum (strain ATCC 200006 / CBS 805.95 / DAOM BR144) TaxID=431595 RepID=K3WAQ1_GLOUD
MSKDAEAGAAGYEGFGSPKPGQVQDDGAVPRRGASIPMLMLISLPRMAIQMTWSAQWAALGPYLGTMLPKWAVQLTQIIGPASGILVAPTTGVFSDRSTNSWGRRRPFLLIASIFSAICWTLMGWTREIGDALGDYGTGEKDVPTSRPWTAFFTVFFYAWMDITVNVVQTPMFLMIADFAGDRQTLGASIGQGWSTIGSIMVAGYIYIFGAAHKSLKWFLAMLSITMLVTVGIACFFGKETPLNKDEVEQTSAWQQIKNAFGSIYTGLKTLPGVLVAYCLVFFFVQYGYTAYNGNKGQFFGFEVYDGEATGADTCDPCSKAQDAYNHGVSVAGGSTDLIFNIVGYLFSWALPFLVTKFGAKWVLVLSLVPQSLLMVMAFTKVVAIDVLIVILTSLSQTTVFALLVPVIVHVFGDKGEIGVYVGALNSANCFGQLLNFAIGAALVETPMGYKLPVFIGGAMSFIGVIIGIFFLKLKMYSM